MNKCKGHRGKTTKTTHVNFRRKISYFQFFITVVILLHSELLPGQVSKHLVLKPGISNSKVFYILSTEINISVVEEEITIPVVTFKHQIVSQHFVPKPKISNSKLFYILSTKFTMSVAAEEITLIVATFKHQRVGNKVYLSRIVTETLDQIQNASTAQGNPKFKVMASRDITIDKYNLIKPFDLKISNTVTSEEDIEKEIIETGNFERSGQENILVIENWLKSQESLTLTKISKFSHIKGLLKDKASDAILGLPLTSENYDEAVAILKSRFGNLQIVI